MMYAVMRHRNIRVYFRITYVAPIRISRSSERAFIGTRPLVLPVSISSRCGNRLYVEADATVSVGHVTAVLPAAWPSSNELL